MCCIYKLHCAFRWISIEQELLTLLPSAGFITALSTLGLSSTNNDAVVRHHPMRAQERCASLTCEIPFEHVAHEALDLSVDLTWWSFTRGSEYRGELHPDGTPLTYAPALGVPASLIHPNRYPVRGYYACNDFDVPTTKSGYQSFTPVHILHLYDSLSNAPYTVDTANTETELLQRPLSSNLELDHQLRVRTLERWWEVKNAQCTKGISRGEVVVRTGSDGSRSRILNTTYNCC